MPGADCAVAGCMNGSYEFPQWREQCYERVCLCVCPLARLFICALAYTQDEVTSQNLWSRYDRHFVGKTRHNAWN